VATLARVDLFATLDEAELAALGERVRRRRYPKGATVFVEGDPGTGLYAVERGRVAITRTSAEGKELVFAVRGPGEFFGDMALLDGEPRSADAVTVEECWLLLLHRDDFLKFLEGHPKATARLLVVLSRRLRDVMQQQEEVSFLDAAGRVAGVLLRLAESRGAPLEPGGIVVDAPPTQGQMASQAGLTRESVNKWLRYYQRRGVIQWEKGRLSVLKPDELRRRAH
jgi:CRP-like cAMP-binding protein